MNRSHRMERVNEMLRSMLSGLILERHPSTDLVTLVTVDTTRDLKLAKVYVSASANLDEHVAALNGLSPELQATIKPRLDFRTIPTLQFVADRSGDAIARVEGILDRL